MDHSKSLTDWTHAGTYTELKDAFCTDVSSRKKLELSYNNCCRCFTKLYIETRNVQMPSRDGEDPQYLPLYFKNCSMCNLYKFIWCCMQWFDISLVLDLASPQYEKIIKRANNPKDHIIIYLLGQICHNQQDIDLTLLESPVGYGNFHCIFNVLLEDGHAKGFNIIKDKSEHEYYNQGLNSFLPLVDFLYIRKKYRSNGLGSTMLKSIIDANVGQNVYFSSPLSSSMCSVLSLLLRNNTSLRDYLWGVDGEVCERFNIYYHLIFQHIEKIK